MSAAEPRFLYFSRWGLKLALASAFLSAVADRFGIWGSAGSEGIAWGDFSSFTAYTAVLAPWASGKFLDLIAWTVTVVEILLGFCFLLTSKRKKSLS